MRTRFAVCVCKFYVHVCEHSGSGTVLTRIRECASACIRTPHADMIFCMFCLHYTERAVRTIMIAHQYTTPQMGNVVLMRVHIRSSVRVYVFFVHYMNMIT